MAVSLSVLAIIFGAVVMLLAIIRIRAVLALLDGRGYRRYWLVMAGLMFLFLVGYIAAAAIVMVGETWLFQLLVGFVFLAGAIFVFLVVEVGYLSISDLEQSRTRLAQRESELERLYEVTNVLNRVLRHNLRNTMNAIIGRSELARSQVDDEHEHHLEKIEQISAELIETSQKARDIKEAIDTDPETEYVSATQLVEQSIEHVTTEFPDVTFETDLPREFHIDANRLLYTAVEHVLDNAARYNDSNTPRVSVSVRADTTTGIDTSTEAATNSTANADADADADTVTIQIVDNGPGIPETELMSLDKSNERPLRHGSGLGLWIVRWILDRCNGHVSFADGDNGGTAVTLTLPRATDTDADTDNTIDPDTDNESSRPPGIG